MLAYLYKQSPPGYSLTIGGASATHELRTRLLSLSVVLNDGEQSDQFTLSVDDCQTLTFGRIQLPDTGKEIQVSLGYDLHKADMGIFHVDQITCNGSGGGGSINITAVPKLLLSEKTRTWADTTIGDIIGEIATDNSLTAKISASLKTVAIAIENQVNETDLSFITRLAKKYDALAKPASNNLLFLVKGESLSASGLPLLPTPITPDNVISWNCQLSDRTEYGSVVAIWHNRVTAAQEQVIEGTADAEPIYRMPHLFTSEAEAKAAAKAQHNRKKRDASTLDLTVVGDPGIVAGGSVMLVKIRSEVDGLWIIKSATHTLSGSGYQCTVSLYRE
ncbi:phage late control D family protein [Teredinibacter purpureus]|uniref:phage late control D family protein n=1 Tax=Teredinibacter purpureus TaxID=2731756 RepID=UPI0005F7D25A|nr:contractile injection system protein, VgrG/Pvc8 family [Teredinibacter purpureus]